MIIAGRALATVCAAGAVLLAAVPGADAHTRRRSYSHWHWDGAEAVVQLRLDRNNLAELIVGPGLERGAIGPGDLRRLSALPARLVADGIRVRQPGGGCELAVVGPVATTLPWLSVRAVARCPAPVSVAGVTITVHLFEGSGMDHTHLMRMRVDAANQQPVALAAGTRTWTWRPDGERSGGRAVATLLRQGVVHVLIGLDHIAFLLTLILVTWVSRSAGRRAREVAWLALAFTLGHSITLAATTLGAVRPRGPTVELLIALSVAGLAVDGLLRSGIPRSHRRALAGAGLLAVLALPALTLIGWAGGAALAVGGTCAFLALYGGWRDPGPGARASVALAFGLIHGFGFAGALAELGLAGADLLVPLLSFNLGVEVGQLLLIALVVPLLHALRGSRHLPLVVQLTCALVLCLGAYWVALRG